MLCKHMLIRLKIIALLFMLTCFVFMFWEDISSTSEFYKTHSYLSSSKKRIRPDVHFRDLFSETYSSNIDTGPDNVPDSTRYLIYRCDGKTLKGCGGWGDRAKGMMAAYIIANLTGRVFKLEMLSPKCDILQYIVPNHVNWSLPVSFHGVVKNSQTVRILNYRDNFNYWKKIENYDFLSLPEMEYKYVYYKSNLDYMSQLQRSTRYQKQLSWMHNLTRAQMNAVIFKRLFKLSPQLHKKLDAFLANNVDFNGQLMCAQLRIGTNPSNPNDCTARVRLEDLPNVWKFFKNHTRGPSDKIFLMSDSDEVISLSLRQSFKDNVIFTTGNVVHIDRSRLLSKKEMCAGFEKVILDQFILMHCDILLNSKSGLSRMSSYVRGSDKGLYCLMDGGRILPCQGSTMQELYGVMG